MNEEDNRNDSCNDENNLNYTGDRKDGNFWNDNDCRKGEKEAEKELQEDKKDTSQKDQAYSSQGQNTFGQEKSDRQKVQNGEEKLYENINMEEPTKSKKRTFAVVLVAITLAFAIFMTVLFGVIGFTAVEGLLWIGDLFDTDSENGMSSSNENMTVVKNDGGINIYPQTGATDGTGPYTIPQVVDLVGDTVVEIKTSSVVTDRFYHQYVTSGAGSGVIIAKEGFIITNYHVIEGAVNITVRLTDGTECSATLCGVDAKKDIALLKINISDQLPFASMGSSKDLVVGQDVIAIGNPLGSLGGTVTNGIISALDREVVVDGNQMTLMQTNAAINPGNSGGGLFDMYGNLIGIVNAKQSETGIEGLGFAIPIDVAWDAVVNMEGVTVKSA